MTHQHRQMGRSQSGAQWLRRRTGFQRGAQSLEWIGLGSFVLAAMTAASVYASNHLGAGLGELLLNHMKTVVGQ